MNKTELKKIVDQADQHCRSRGARLTHRRKQVLSGLLKSQKALSAYELMDVCQAEYGENLPAMSAYRILDFLQQEHLVHKLKLANKYVACAHIACEHAHEVPQFLICNQCQKVKEIGISKLTITKLRKHVEQAGYRLASPQMELNCVCETCLSGVELQ